MTTHVHDSSADVEEKPTGRRPSERRQGLRGRRWFALTLSVIVLGVVVGCSSGLLSLFLEAIQHLFLGFQETSAAPSPSAVAPWRRVVSVTVGGIVVAVVWWLLRNKTRRVPSVKAAVAGKEMPWWQTLLHVVAQMFFVGTGASIGREVAPREAGSMLAQKWMRVGIALGLRRSDGPLLVAAGAGAGFAGVYISPLTGMFFSVEILLKRIDHETVLVSLGMSVIATVVGGAIKGTAPYYSVGSQSFAPSLMVVAVLIALVAGCAGGAFRRATRWAESHQTTSAHILWQLPFAGLLTGVAAMWAPQLTGNGRALAQAAFDITDGFVETATGAVGGSSVTDYPSAVTTVALLAVWCAMKAVLTVLTIRSGASGGTLTPSIAMGSCIGAIMGILLMLVTPTAGIHVWQCAMIGAVSLLAASQQAPLMALMMLIEITHLPIQSVISLGLAAVVSVAVSKFVVKTPHTPGLEGAVS